MTALDHVALPVDDFGAQAAWRSPALGLHRRERGGIPSIGLRVVFRVNLDKAIELLMLPGSQPGFGAPDAPTSLLNQGYENVCLRVADVEGAYVELLAVGATSRMRPGASPVAGARIAFVADREGNLIEKDRPGPPGKLAP